MSITIQLDLSESVAAKARAKGLLDPASVSRLIERELDLEEPQRAYREMVEQMRACPDDEPMTMDEIQAEVKAARGHAGLLQLNDHQRQAVDEADKIRPAQVVLA